MPYLETPGELADDIANKLGIYGAHDHDNEYLCEKHPCRCCFVAGLTERIRDSVRNEALVSGSEARP